MTAYEEYRRAAKNLAGSKDWAAVREVLEGSADLAMADLMKDASQPEHFYNAERSKGAYKIIKAFLSGFDSMVSAKTENDDVSE